MAAKKKSETDGKGPQKKLDTAAPPAKKDTSGSLQPTPETVIESGKEARAHAGIVSFPIVGIGGSAGGLEAFSQLLERLPADTGMAFVIVQHLAPTHTSMLAEILSRSSSMPVTEVQDEPTVAPNHVYVIPPARSMIISKGHLKLLPRPEGRGAHRPFDAFLRSLAEDQGHRAIGVILSGTGNDGTLGLTAIKADGGITFAQDETAQQGGMPRSAIAEGCVDFVLPADRIAEELTRIGKHPYVVPARISDDSLAESNVNKILRMLHQITGVDFTNYKSTTLYRRITRRMLLQKLEGLEQYYEFLQGNLGELQALYRDILISVTSFFRDPAEFDFLRKEVFPQMVKDRMRNDPIRAWVLGCSTGEEAYSMAISFAEYSREHDLRFPIQIFATDLNEFGIEKARSGIYDKAIEEDISSERLRRYFVEMDGGYQISKSIRESCIFARQNVLTDPPFSRLDLISCRNLLIYMEPVLQRRILPLFHYALRPSGYLWLGSSETVGAFADRFTPVDPKHKIFAKSGISTVFGAALPFTLPSWGSPGYHEKSRPFRAPEAGGNDAQREADRVMLARYAPCGVVINREWEIVQFRGDTSRFLAPAPGKPSMNILKMAREGLLVSLRASLIKARKEGKTVREEGLHVKSNGGFHEMSLEIIPLQEVATDDRSFLVLFEEPGSPEIRAARIDEKPAGESLAPPGEPEDPERQIRRMTHELASTREYLQSLIEQQDAANEELQSANEEIQSSNEELQSVNEELQTTKEEIQSSNEELTTVNEELRDRNEQLNQYNNDLVNFLSSTNLALIMLGPDLKIRRFTPLAEKLLNLISSDVGRPIDNLRLPLAVPNLQELLTEVIDNVVVKEQEVQDKQKRWYSLRIRPYKTIDNKIDGAVIVLVDIDAQKKTEHLLRVSEERYRILSEGARGIATVLFDEQGRVTGWNDGAQRMFGYADGTIVGQPLSQFFQQEDIDAGRPQRDLAIAASGQPAAEELWLVRQDRSRFWAHKTTVCLRSERGAILGYLIIVWEMARNDP